MGGTPNIDGRRLRKMRKLHVLRLFEICERDSRRSSAGAGPDYWTAIITVLLWTPDWVTVSGTASPTGASAGTCALI